MSTSRVEIYGCLNGVFHKIASAEVNETNEETICSIKNSINKSIGNGSNCCLKINNTFINVQKFEALRVDEV